MPKAKRKVLTGCWSVGKAAVAGVKGRAMNRVNTAVVPGTDSATLQGFVRVCVKVYTDDAAAYRGMPEVDHRAVNHSVGEYVRGVAYTNGMESFWSMLKRGYHGTFHHRATSISAAMLRNSPVATTSGDFDMKDQMALLVRGMSGKRLRYADLTA